MAQTVNSPHQITKARLRGALVLNTVCHAAGVTEIMLDLTTFGLLKVRN